MVHCTLNDLYRAKYVVLWMLLSMKAGYLNAAGFLSTGKFVSHVTGFGTQIGVSLTHRQHLFGIELLIIPISFILGSSLPAWMLDRNYSPDRLPKYYRVQILITVCLALIFILGMDHDFGNFSRSEDNLQEIFLLGMLCFVCGMKNGLSTWATFGKIRTTHLTGLSTDIGLNLPKLFRGQAPSRFPEPRTINTVRLMTFLSFSTGSLLAAFIFPSLEYGGFVFPLVASIILSLISIANHNYHLRKKRLEARQSGGFLPSQS